MVERYAWDGASGQFVDRRTREPMHKPFEGQVCLPNVQSDIPEYRSPIDGKLITSRSHRREDMARNNCIDARDLPREKNRTKEGTVRSPAFAKKYGLPLAEESR